MFNSSEKIIIPNQIEAKAMADYLMAQTGVKHDVYPLPSGFQIVPIKVLAAYMPPAVPHPVATPEKIKKHLMSAVMAKPVENKDTMSFTFKFKGVANVYLDVIMPDNTVKSFGKTNLVDYTISEDKSEVTIIVTKQFAKKRGLI